MKKIRRTRIRTETSRLVFIREQTAETSGGAAGGHEVCPTCGQPVIAPAETLPAICAEAHPDEPGETLFRLEKTGETE